MSLQQMNSAITTNNNFFPSLRAILENIFLRSLQKKTDSQYSSVELEQAKLASDSLCCTWTKLFNFKVGAFQNKNTRVMIISVEMVYKEKYQTSKNQISAGIYL